MSEFDLPEFDLPEFAVPEFAVPAVTVPEDPEPAPGLVGTTDGVHPDPLGTAPALDGPLPGPPTVDSDADGLVDTAITVLDDGDLLLATDADHDGDTDAATRITASGAISAHHDGPAVRVDAHGFDDGAPPTTATPPPAPSIDPVTGGWTRS